MHALLFSEIHKEAGTFATVKAPLLPREEKRMFCEKSEWIWLAQQEDTPDCYGEFVLTAVVRAHERVRVLISADSNYSLCVNGVFADSGQYPDFPYAKVADELDITDLCQVGENRLALTVWYYGQGSSTYYPGRAAVRAEVWCGDMLRTCTDCRTPSRKSPAYQNARAHYITRQLGFGYRWDAQGADEWESRDVPGFRESRVVNQQLPVSARPLPKGNILPFVCAKLIKNEKNCLLFDLGREEVGYLSLSIRSLVRQNIVVAFGEHVLDGWVRRRIADRDFSVEIVLRPGVTRFDHRMRRLGARYLQVQACAPVVVERIGLCPVSYPFHRLPGEPADARRRDIYQMCVRTLELCMHDHYEDCPWREQALYVLDSRNQMLCGYYAFGEKTAARASLSLIAKGKREDGLLPICTPAASPLAIPSFSLFYFTEVSEYLDHTADLSLAREVFEKLKSVLSVFTDRVRNGRIPLFTGKYHWNFYEWSDDLSGQPAQQTHSRQTQDAEQYEAPLHFLLVLALRHMAHICDALGEASEEYRTLADQVAHTAGELFFDTERALYVNRLGEYRYSELTNSLALLCGAADAERAAGIVRALGTTLGAEDVCAGEMTPITLAMLGFKYDALLQADAHRWRAPILSDIDRRFSRMLDAGATSVWETEKGAADFEGAGSLCHGWSAMPVYYYRKLLPEFSKKDNLS